MPNCQYIGVGASLFAFNIPVIFGLIILFIKQADVLKAVASALREKNSPSSSGETSYSRITGFIGAVIITSLFWVLSNVVVADSILDPQRIAVILSSSGKLFLIGSALFLPYAFNQLKSIF